MPQTTDGNVKREKNSPCLIDLPAPKGATGGDRCEHSLDPVSSPATLHGLRAVDLFCGIGGLSYGLRCRGIDVVAGYDVDPSCRYAYEANNDGAAFAESDIRDLSYSDLKHHYCGADVSILVGCAPCQPFSAHTRRSKEQRNDCSLLDEFSRIVAEGKPDIVSIENVPGLSKHDAALPIHKISRHIGNAVPVKLAEAIGDAILEAVNGQ